MLLYNVTIIISVIGLAYGSPTSSSCKIRSVPQDASFEDLPQVPGDAFLNIPQGYKGLYFQGLQYATVVSAPGGQGVAGITPHSPPNYAVTGVVIQTAAGTPMLTVNFPNSNSTSFDLESFYFGCALNDANTAGSAPTICNLEVTGYRGPDNQVSGAKQVASQQFQYNPSTYLGVQQPTFAKLNDDFSQLSFAILTISLPGGEAAAATLEGAVFDNFKYALHYCA